LPVGSSSEWSLRVALTSVCDEALRVLPEGPARDGVLQVRATLAEPLRVAVSGSVSSGKSTLVNALLGQRIAAVDQGECTHIVTWFQYDHFERIVVEHRDGTTRTLTFEEGHRIPDDLGAKGEDIRRLVVYLSNERLRELTIIDTPGLNTVTEANEAVTTDLLGLDDDSKVATDSRMAMTEADALVFLMPHVRAHDVAVLTQFRNLFDGSGLSAVNVVGVLSKIDKLTPDGDPWPTARRLSERAKDELRSVLCDVIPVNGLLAETALTDRFSEDDTHALRKLAQLDEFDLEDQLLTQTEFLEATEPGDVPPERRTRLLSMLDLHGVALAVEALREPGADGGDAADGGSGGGADTVDTRELLALLEDRSGFAPLSMLVTKLFSQRADALKAHAGLAALRRLTADTHRRDDDDSERPDPDQLRSVQAALERIELAPELHDLRLFEVLRRVDEGDIKVPEDLALDLRRLTLENDIATRLGTEPGASADELGAAAKAKARAWATWGNDPRRGPLEERFADDVRSAYELLWHKVNEEGGDD